MNSKLLVALALVAMLAVFCPAAMADNGDGSNDGKNVPLMLVSSDPGNGSAGVTLDASITLGFNKNVINMSVRDNNRGQFSLSGNGQAVPFSVIMADDQMEPEMKRIITIAPRGPLAPGTTYSLTIGSGLTAKSGASLGSDVIVTFTTVQAESAAPPPAPADTASTVKPESQVEPTGDNAAADSKPADSNPVNPVQIADQAQQPGSETGSAVPPAANINPGQVSGPTVETVSPGAPPDKTASVAEDSRARENHRLHPATG